MSANGPSAVRLIATQTRAQLLIFRRTPVAAFFTLFLPIIMLVLFNALFGGGTIETEGGDWPVRQFYTGGLAAFAAVSATFTNLGNTVPILRDEGILKRWRGTPLPPWAYVAGMVTSAVVIAIVGVVFMLALGVVAYDLEIDAAKMPAAALTFVVGVAAFAALGLACAALVPNARSAPAVVNAAILPLAFISNVFIPLDDPPAWIDAVGNFFPLRPFVTSFQDAFNPFLDGSSLNAGALGWIAVWGVVGAAVAVAKFRWEPSSGGSSD